MKTSTMMWIGGGIAVWYFFLRDKGGATGQATGASTVNPATSGPATSGPAAGQSVAYELDEPDIEYYGQNARSWQPGWSRSGGGRRHHHHRGGGHRRR